MWTLPIDLTDPEHPKPGKPEPFLADPAFVEVDPSFSPDGKFLAYTSGESGTEQVFVRSFPGPGGKWKVSANGGKFPAWSAATHELFFLGGDDRIIAASYTIQGDSFSAGVPRVWSPTPVRRNSVQLNFDITSDAKGPDGPRVIMFPQPVAETSTGNLHATFLLNFFDELRRKVPRVSRLRCVKARFVDRLSLVREARLYRGGPRGSNPNSEKLGLRDHASNGAGRMGLGPFVFTVLGARPQRGANHNQ